MMKRHDRWFADRFVLGLLLLGPLLATAAEPVKGPPEPDTVVVTEPLPPPASGRLVVADAQTLVFEVKDRKRTLHDLDAEASDVIAQINRSPSTWQCYLLYTQRDLPDILFMPGFAIQLDKPHPPRKQLVVKPSPPAPPAATTPATPQQ